MTGDLSDALVLLKHVYAKQGEAFKGFSFTRLNQVMRQTLIMAAAYGFKFNEDDLEHLHLRCGAGHWLDSDQFYSAACGVGGFGYANLGPCNISACRAFEHYRQIKPYRILQAGHKKSIRLAIGIPLKWQGHQVRVTSLNGERIIACAKEYKGGKWVITKRFTITHTDLALHNKAERTSA